MTKYHIADRYNAFRPACDPNGYKRAPLVLSIEDWVHRLCSEQCQRCAKERKGLIDQIRWLTGENERNGKH